MATSTFTVAASSTSAAAAAAARSHRFQGKTRTFAPPLTSLVVNPLHKHKHGRISVSLGRRKLVVPAARIESGGVSLGFKAPNFELPEPLTGKTWNLQHFDPYPGLLVMFICNHCPFVKHLKMDLVKLSNFYMEKGLAVAAISSNSAVTHPQDGPELMAEDARVFNYPFPYLYDESQEVARDFGAVCTPEFFLFKKDGRRPFELVYHGQFDDSRPSNNVPVTGRDLSLAIDCVLSGQPVPAIQKPRFSDNSSALVSSPKAVGAGGLLKNDQKIRSLNQLHFGKCYK